MAHSATSSMMNLPTEIHILIAENLDYASKVSLHQANQYFHSIVNVQPPVDPAQKTAFLRVYEQWPENANKYACFQCHTILPADEFDDAQKTGRRAKTGTDVGNRFCIPCGLLKRLFNPMAPITIRGKVYYRCASCKGLQGWGTRCAWCCQCSHCLGYGKLRVIQADRCPECGCRGGLHDVGPEGTPAPQTTQSSGDNPGEETTMHNSGDALANQMI